MKLFLLVAVIVIAGFFAWKKVWSKEAVIERHYQACMVQIGHATVKLGINGPLPSELSDSISEGEQSGAVVCDSLHKACLADFDSKGCKAMRFAFDGSGPIMTNTNR